ncbi:hypothetical protein ACIQPR_42335 [Streptomyces sp. NPDC091280]|uniref:hypothetical protein n=1 Tax=unclassified Streptomyces TaxID=2593676 RepID=UPI0037F74236
MAAIEPAGASSSGLPLLAAPSSGPGFGYAIGFLLLSELARLGTDILETSALTTMDNGIVSSW